MKKYSGYKHLTDYDMMQEVMGYKLLFGKMEDSVVLDIGANIGAFSYQALKNGSKLVVSVEPSKRNYDFLENQAFVKRFEKLGKIKLLNKAVVHGNEKNVLFYEGTGKNTGLDGLYKRRTQQNEYYVPTIKFEDILKKYQPTILKIDVEGAERYYDFSKIPASVKHIAIELHYSVHKDNWFLNSKTEKNLRQQFPYVLKNKDNIIFGSLATTELILSRSRYE